MDFMRNEYQTSSRSFLLEGKAYHSLMTAGLGFFLSKRLFRSFFKYRFN